MKAKSLSPDLDKIEMLPDAWERTARAVKAAVAPAPKKKAAPKRRSVVRKGKA